MDKKAGKYIYYFTIGLILILSILFRTYMLGLNNEFGDDECRLLLTMTGKSYLQLFGPIGYAQSAPPLYLVILKFMGDLSGQTEFCLKFLPYIFSLCSIFLFFKLSKIFFKHKYSILLANALFCTNHLTIIFGSIIKQYSLDMLVSILLTYYFSRIKIKDLTTKQFIILTLSIILLPFISLPSLFFIGAFFVLNLINDYKNRVFLKKFLILSLPLLITLILYYVFNLAPSKNELDKMFPDYWLEGFLFTESLNPLRVFVIYLKTMFFPNNLSLFQLILWIIGIYCCVKDKSQISNYILWAFTFVILGAVTQNYPFLGRVALYFVPILILFIIKPIDTVEIKKNCKSFLLIICYIISFCGYNANYFANDIIHYKVDKPKTTMRELIVHYNPNTDIILINQASVANFLYYSHKFNFIPAKSTDLLTIKNGIDIKQEVSEYIDNLNPNYDYWLYLSKDFASSKNVDVILECIKEKNILYSFYNGSSYLIKFHK